MDNFMISLGTIPVVTTRMKIDDGFTLSGMDALMILTQPNGGVRRCYIFILVVTTGIVPKLIMKLSITAIAKVN